MKRYFKILLLVVVAIFTLTGCIAEETAPKEKELEVLHPLEGSKLEKTHKVEGFEFITTYDANDYSLDRWRVTDSKFINMSARVKNLPEGAIVLIEHVHIDMSIKSEDPQLDGYTQDSMDDSYHGTSQDGFYVSETYNYQNKFAIEGFSKELIDGWMFICDATYGTGSMTQKRLTEENLITYGKVYANKMQVVYKILVKYEGEEFFHVVSVSDEFLIPVGDDVEIAD